MAKALETTFRGLTDGLRAAQRSTQRPVAFSGRRLPSPAPKNLAVVPEARSAIRNLDAAAPGPSDAIAAPSESDMSRRARVALFGLVRRGARRVLRRTLTDIAYRIWGRDAEPVYLTVPLLLRSAELAFSAERDRARTGHWTHDINRLLSMAEIVVALRHRTRIG